MNSWIKLIKEGGGKYRAWGSLNIFYSEENLFKLCNMQDGILKTNYNSENFRTSHKAERMFNLQSVSKDEGSSKCPCTTAFKCNVISRDDK